MTMPRTRDAVLALLLRGDLIARSELAYPRLLTLLHEALRDRLPGYTRRDVEDPGDALLAAFAAALDSLGFYHDRFLTESKLAAAQRLQSVARLAAAVGFRPRPPIAAATLQHFVARTLGLVPAGTAVAGTGATGSVHYETRRSLTIGPAFNRMRLAPVIAAHADARHAVIQQSAATPDGDLSPIDDFMIGDLVLVSGAQGAELLATAAARQRAVAFAQGLRRSYIPAAWDSAAHESPPFDLRREGAVTPATQLRRLRGWTLYEHPGHNASYAVAELSRDPILHLRDETAPNGLRSSLELVVLEPAVDLGDPTSWPANAYWTEVSDFTDSEADDLHFRTFVDDRMRVYVQLRVRIGHRLLLAARRHGQPGELRCERLDHVYARFTPAIGAPPHDGPGESDIAVLQLDPTYFADPIVVCKAAAKPSKSPDRTWAMLDRSLAVAEASQIVVLDEATDTLNIRTLATCEGPYISWKQPPADPGESDPDVPRPLWHLLRDPNFTPLTGSWYGLADRYDVEAGRGSTTARDGDWPTAAAIVDAGEPVDPPLERAKTKVALLEDAVTTGAIRFLLDYYRHTTNPAWRYQISRLDLHKAKPGTPGLPDAEALDGQWVVETLLMPRGELYVLLENTGSLKPGDYFLLGKRLRQRYHAALRTPTQFPPEDQPQIAQLGVLDPRWLVAEVLQAVEVQGKVVRLKYPLQNDYTADLVFPADAFTELHVNVDDLEVTGDPVDMLTEIVAIPNVASVYYADKFMQTIELSPIQNFIKIPPNLQYAYTKYPLLPPINEQQPSFAERMGWSDLPLGEAFAQLFVGIPALAVPLAGVTTEFKVTLARSGGLPPLARLHRFSEPAKPAEVADAAQVESPDHRTLTLSPASFAALAAFTLAIPTTGLLAEPQQPAKWATLTPNEPGAPGEFRVVASGWPSVKLPERFDDLTGLMFVAPDAKVEWFDGAAIPGSPDAVAMEKVPALPAPWTVYATRGSEPIGNQRFVLGERLQGWTGNDLKGAKLLVRYGADDCTEISAYTTPNADTVDYQCAKRFVGDALPRPTEAYLLYPQQVKLNSGNVLAVWEFKVSAEQKTLIESQLNLLNSNMAIVVGDRPHVQSKVEHFKLDTKPAVRTTATASEKLVDLSSAKLALLYSGLKTAIEIDGEFIDVPKALAEVTHVVLYPADNTAAIVRTVTPDLNAKRYILDDPPADSDIYTGMHPAFAVDNINLVGRSLWTMPADSGGGVFIAYNAKHAKMLDGTWLPGNRFLSNFTLISVTDEVGKDAIGAGVYGLWTKAKAIGTLQGVHLADNQALLDRFAGHPWPRMLFDSPSKILSIEIDVDTLGQDPVELEGNVKVETIAKMTRVGPAQMWSPVEDEAVTAGGGKLIVQVAKLASNTIPIILSGDRLRLPTPGPDTTYTVESVPVSVGSAWQLTMSEPLKLEAAAIEAIEQHRLLCDAPLAAFTVGLSFLSPNPPSALTPYILAGPPGDPLAPALLRHSALTPIAPDRHALTFGTAEAMLDLAGHIGDELPALAYLPNARDQLFVELYIGGALNKPFNFLSEEQPIGTLFTRQKSDFATVAPEQTPFILGKLGGGGMTDAQIADLYEGTLGDGIDEASSRRAFSQSLVFNTGNFIPVRLAAALVDKQIVENSLRLTVHFDDNTEATLTYDEDLATHLLSITNEENKDDDLESLLNIYSFNKTNEGVFTLNILCINDIGLYPRSVDIQVVYSAPRDPEVEALLNTKLDDAALAELTKGWDDHALYLHETRVRPWNPQTQLILLDPERLKVGDHLFLRRGVIGSSSATPDFSPIQWTRVQQVDGRMVSVWPPLHYQPRQIDRYVLGTFRAPVKYANLDAAYYRLIHEEGQDHDLPLGKSLILDHNDPALRELIPGDRLLVWDADLRSAWADHRRGEAPTPDWRTWPEAQHEVVIKAIDPATGLITLKDPLPARFAVHFGAEPDSARLRIYPHIREPFQGRRTRRVLGDGDRSARFQHFSAELDQQAHAPAFGHYSVHSDRAGTFVSNHEVLSRDPRSGEWARWTEFEDLADAQRKDLAVTVGAEPRPGPRLALELRFGDNVHGQPLPSGQRNVHLRSVDTGELATLLGFASWRDLAVELDEVPHECLPIPADPRHLRPRAARLTVEHGGHAHWQPRQAQRDRWVPALWVGLRRGDAIVPLPELSDAEALAGREGYIVRPCDPPRPGACWIYLCSLTAHDDLAALSFIDRPQAEPWRLDRDFYRELLDVDLTQSQGARQVPLDETDGLRDGALLAYYDADDDLAPELATVAKLDPDTYSALLADGLRRSYELGRAHLLGNLVEVDQGKRDTYVIGSGDSGIRDLRLALFNRAPIMHRQGTATDPEPWLDVLVDGVAWRRVAAFDDSGPHDRVYRVDLEPDGHAAVAFGDGQRGQIPATGRDNIEVRLHLGDGAVGNLPAGAIDVLRDGNLAVQSTRNITAASGGRPAEDAAEARSSLLARGPFHARAVTAADLVRVACSIGDIQHAARDPHVVDHHHRLVVALTDRRRPDEIGLAALRDRLRAQLPAATGCDLELVPATPVPAHLVVEIEVAAGYLAGEVLAAIDRVFAADGDGFFAAERWPIGASLRLGDVYEQLHAVVGVADVTVLWMSQRPPPRAQKLAAAERIDPGPAGQITCAPGLRTGADPSRGSLLVRVKGGPR